jgi:hypothetical protein
MAENATVPALSAPDEEAPQGDARCPRCDAHAGVPTRASYKHETSEVVVLFTCTCGLLRLQRALPTGAPSPETALDQEATMPSPTTPTQPQTIVHALVGRAGTLCGEGGRPPRTRDGSIVTCPRCLRALVCGDNVEKGIEG